MIGANIRIETGGNDQFRINYDNMVFGPLPTNQGGAGETGNPYASSFTNVRLVNPSLGGAGLRFNALGASPTVPTNIVWEGQVGYGPAYGNGIEVDAGQGITILADAIVAKAAAVFVGPASPSGPYIIAPVAILPASMARHAAVSRAWYRARRTPSWDSATSSVIVIA